MAKQLILNNLSFSLTNKQSALQDVSLSFENKKYGIIGNNGAGKSTLLKLIIGELTPDTGSIQCNGKIAYVPQQLNVNDNNTTIANIIDVHSKLIALQNISNGSSDPKDYEIVGDDWEFESRLNRLRQQFAMESIALDTPFATLSGGQKTKILLIHAFLENADFYLLDEPTNNLDVTSRTMLYQMLDESNKGYLIISHDRTLLNQMESIVEITQKKINCYGGNYDFYYEQKSIEDAALQQHYLDAKKSLKKTRQSIQQSKEKHEQRASKGKKLARTGKIDKSMANSMRGRSEKTKSRLTTQAELSTEKATANLNDIKEKLESNLIIDASLEKTKLANNKVVLDIESLLFAYPGNSKLLSNLNIKLIGNQRLAISGKNGSGKTTLIKLIRGLLQPTDGTITVGVENIAYFDQTVGFLDPNKTLIENFIQHNPDSNRFDAYSALAQFTFRNQAAEKKVAELSGGEKMRAGLAIQLMAKTPPQLIILDEPTNHLDINSIKAIETILNHYQGAILAVSHDQVFLDNIGITKTFKLSSD